MTPLSTVLTERIEHKYNYKYILESLHVTNVFDDVIDNIIVRIIQEYKKQTVWFYTDYCYFRNYNICKKYPIDINYNSDNEDIIPIFIDIEDKKDNTLLEINNRIINDVDFNTHIVIHINKNNIDFNDTAFLYGGFKHECLYALEMYILHDINLLDLPKNFDGINNIDNIFNLNDNEFEFIQQCLYNLSLSEQRAKLNGTAGYVQKLNSDIKYKLSGKSILDTIENYVEYTKKHNCLFKFFNCLNKLNEYISNKYYKIIYILGYYLCGYNVIKNISKNIYIIV